MIKKLLIYSFMLFVAYKGLSYYTTYSASQKLLTCVDTRKLNDLKASSAPMREKLLVSTKGWRCVKKKQNYLEALFYKIPKEWTDPPLKFVDPPFTEEELGGEVVINTEIKDDLAILQKSFSQSTVNFSKTLHNITSKVGTNIEISNEFLLNIKNLNTLIVNLEMLKFKTSEVSELHQKLIKSFYNTNSDLSVMHKTYQLSTELMDRSDVILALPKPQIVAHKSELLEMHAKLDSYAAKLEIQNNNLQNHTKESDVILDEIDLLARKNGFLNGI